MPWLNYLYTNPAWEHLLLMESHVMGSETISDCAMGECGSQPGRKGKTKDTLLMGRPAPFQPCTRHMIYREKKRGDWKRKRDDCRTEKEKDRHGSDITPPSRLGVPTNPDILRQ